MSSRSPEHRRFVPWPGFLIFFASFCVIRGNVVAANVLPDPRFANVSELGVEPRRDAWNWQRIAEPCGVRAEQNKATLHGGRVFLHSAEFPVDASTLYELRLEASGTATFAVEMLWWKKDGLSAGYHRSILMKPRPLTADVTKIKASIRSPRNAATAYLRFAAEGGEAVLNSPVMRAAAGELLLKLDAAAPGPEPNSRWKDLTGRNKDFRVESAHHSVKANSYVFEKPNASCIGNLQDAAQFDFETDRAAGAGQGSPFTVVLYAKFSGRCGSGIVNKFSDPTKGGWSIGLEWDQFGLDRISTLQQSDNRQNRSINGFPGLAGQGRDVKLSATDGRFHLYVIHLTGSGVRDGSVYFDGNDKPLSWSAWPFGILSSGSVCNDAPLRIGSFNKNGFRGEIGFVEIWSGSRLQDGMTPAEYSRYRHNQGSPLRAR